MLQFIRSKVSSIFVKALFVLLIASFAVWGIGDVFLGSPGGREAVIVGDVAYNSAEVLTQYDRMQRRRNMPADADQAERARLLDTVIEAMEERGLIESGSRDMRLIIGDDQLKSWISEQDNFRDEVGQFNPDLFRRALAFSGYSEERFFAGLRSDLKRDQLTTAITATATGLPDTIAQTLFAWRGEQRRIKLVHIPTKDITDLDEPDAAMLTAYYDENLRRFKAPEYRSGFYAFLSPTVLAAEILIPEEEIQADYDARIDEFTDPASRLLDQFIFPDEEAAQAAYDALAALDTEDQTDGEKAKEGEKDKADKEAGKEADKEGAESDEPPATPDTTIQDAIAESLKAAAGADSTTSLGTIIREDLTNDAERDAAFALARDEVSPPIDTPFGWKLFLAREASPETISSFEEVKTQIRDEHALEEARDAIFELANAFEDALAGGADLEEAARAIDLEVKAVSEVAQNGRGVDGERVPDLPAGRLFLTTLFTTNLDTPSDLVETDDGGYFLLRVDKITPSRQKTEDEVTDDVRAGWENKERRRIAEEKAAELMEQTKGGVGLADAAKAGDAEYEVTEIDPFDRSGRGGPNLGLYGRELPGIIFELEAVGAVGTTENAAGATVAELVEIIAADPEEQKDLRERIDDELKGALERDYMEGYLAGLRLAWPPKVNRAWLDAQLQQ